MNKLKSNLIVLLYSVLFCFGLNIEMVLDLSILFILFSMNIFKYMLSFFIFFSNPSDWLNLTLSDLFLSFKTH